VIRGFTLPAVPEVGLALMLMTGAVFGATTVTVAEPDGSVPPTDDVQLIGKLVVESMLVTSCESEAPVLLVQGLPSHEETFFPSHERVELPPESISDGLAEIETLAPEQELATIGTLIEAYPVAPFAP